MRFNYSKLLGKIKEVLGSQSAFSVKMGWSERTTSLKLTGKREWKQGEIEKACHILNIPNGQIVTYFFAADVQY